MPARQQAYPARETVAQEPGTARLTRAIPAPAGHESPVARRTRPATAARGQRATSADCLSSRVKRSSRIRQMVSGEMPLMRWVQGMWCHVSQGSALHPAGSRAPCTPFRFWGNGGWDGVFEVIACGALSSADGNDVDRAGDVAPSPSLPLTGGESLGCAAGNPIPSRAQIGRRDTTKTSRVQGNHFPAGFQGQSPWSLSLYPK